MAKKQFFLIVDVESTLPDQSNNNTAHVADFGACVVDRSGRVFETLACLVSPYYFNEKLFYDNNASNIWGLAGLRKREQAYAEMLNVTGRRVLSSVPAINTWLDSLREKYGRQIELCAYNLSFDMRVCKSSGVRIDKFPLDRRLCLWGLALGTICQSRKFKQWALDNGNINPPTKLGNMCLQTSAEAVYSYLTKDPKFIEDHTGFEDAHDVERIILMEIVKYRKFRSKSIKFSWQEWQARKHFFAR